jgi:membrane-associated phospholipid phosphatase
LVARIVLIILAALAIVTGIVFAADPALDIDGADFFRDMAIQPATIPLAEALEFLRNTGPLLTLAVIAPAVVALVMKLFWPHRRAPMSIRAALFLILSLTLGPGLLVNHVLKEKWARPRPVTVLAGEHAFMPWWDPRGACDTNCSFVSGETSTAVWLAAPAVLAPPPWRTAALGAVAVYASGMSFQRMLMGAHYPSDVLFAAIFTALVIWAVHGLLYRWPAARVTDAALDVAFARIGSAILRPFSARWRRIRTEKPSPPT